MDQVRLWLETLPAVVGVEVQWAPKSLAPVALGPGSELPRAEPGR